MCFSRGKKVAKKVGLALIYAHISIFSCIQSREIGAFLLCSVVLVGYLSQYIKFFVWSDDLGIEHTLIYITITI